MSGAEVCLSDIDGWDFDPPDWWAETWYDDPVEIAASDHAQVDPKIEALLSQAMPF